MSRCARKEGRTGGLRRGSQSENLATSLSIGKRGRVEGDSCKIPILVTTDLIGNCEGDNQRCKRNR